MENYTVGENVSVDESMIKYKGRSSLNQCVPMELIKRGFKILTPADSQSRYVDHSHVYQGKESSRVAFRRICCKNNGFWTRIFVQKSLFR